MKTKLYSIYDNKAACFNAPFALRTDAEAVRTLKGLANDPQTRIGQFPADFSLYCVAGFDDQTGMIVDLVSPSVLISQALSLVDDHGPKSSPDIFDPVQKAPVNGAEKEA